MRTSLIALAVLASAAMCQTALARDLLAPSNLQSTTRLVAAADEPVVIKQPFSTMSGQAGYVCSVSGLGHTSVCTIHSWAQRRSNFLDVAYR